MPVPVRGATQRALLALLALRPGQPVSADRLIDVLWGDGQAAHSANALQAQIGQLRRTLGPAAIVTSDTGYALDVGPDDVDVVRFAHLVAQGRRLAEARRPADASATLGEALGLRRAEPLAEFTYAGLFDAERAHLDELALVASESWANAELGLGRHGELAAGLEALCREHRCASACGCCSSSPVPGRPPGRGPARLHRNPRPPGRRARHRPWPGPERPRDPHPGPAPLAQPRTSPARTAPACAGLRRASRVRDSASGWIAGQGRS